MQYFIKGNPLYFPREREVRGQGQLHSGAPGPELVVIQCCSTAYSEPLKPGTWTQVPGPLNSLHTLSLMPWVQPWYEQLCAVVGQDIALTVPSRCNGHCKPTPDGPMDTWLQCRQKVDEQVSPWIMYTTPYYLYCQYTWRTFTDELTFVTILKTSSKSMWQICIKIAINYHYLSFIYHVSIKKHNTITV